MSRRHEQGVELFTPGPRYRPERLLGAGSYGHVILARDLELDRPVAIKVLSHDRTKEIELARFRREARLTAALNHPGIVRLYDHGETDEGAVYIVYEYLPGIDLATCISRQGFCDPDEVRRWARQMAAALATAHEAGILHRDVKPANVILRDEHDAVLCDFGMARGFSGEEEDLTRTGSVVGTPYYLAPELWWGDPPREESDQFSWAATFFEAAFGMKVWDVSGVNPMRGPGALRDWCARIPEGRDDVSEVFRRVLLRALRSEPEDRYPSMAVAVRALDREEAPSPSGAGACGGQPEAPSEEPSRSPPESPEGAWLPSSPWRVPLAVAAGVVLAFGGWILGGLHGRTPITPSPSPVAVATPPASREVGGPAGRAAAAVEKALERLVAPHRDEAGGFPDSDDGHLCSLWRELIGPTAPLRLGRLHEAIVRWLEVHPARRRVGPGRPFGDPETRLLLQRIEREYGDHLLEDYEWLHDLHSGNAEQFVVLASRREDHELLTELRARHGELTVAFQGFLEELGRLFPEPPLAIRRLQVMVAASFLPAETPSLHRDAVRRWHESEAVAERRELLGLMEELLDSLADQACSPFTVMESSRYASGVVPQALQDHASLLGEYTSPATERLRVADAVGVAILRIEWRHPELVASVVEELFPVCLEELRFRARTGHEEQVREIVRRWRRRVLGRTLPDFPGLRGRVRALEEFSVELGLGPGAKDPAAEGGMR